MSEETSLDITKIKELLPHRYPFLLVDRVLKIDDKYIEALKNVTVNEPFFQGHFPHEPIMPGVLIIEAMAQSGGIYAMKKYNFDSSTSVYFMTIDKVKFRQPVRPGDQLIFKIEILRESPKMMKMAAKAYVANQLVTEAELMAMIAHAQKSNS